MRETLPLHRVHEAVFEFCRGRADAIVFGAQAVNVQVSEPRMTQDVDLLSAEPRRLAEELAAALHGQFHVAIRVCEIKAEVGYRVYQVRTEGPRHLADVRKLEKQLDFIEIDGVRYVGLVPLIAMKVCALARRRAAPKGATDLADLRRLLLAHPELVVDPERVEDEIRALHGGDEASAAWRELVSTPIPRDDEDEGY